MLQSSIVKPTLVGSRTTIKIWFVIALKRYQLLYNRHANNTCDYGVRSHHKDDFSAAMLCARIPIVYLIPAVCRGILDSCGARVQLFC